MTKKPPSPPEFTLTATNQAAPGVIRMWCVQSQRHGYVSLEEVNEAYRIADEMEAWHDKHGEKR